MIATERFAAHDGVRIRYLDNQPPEPAGQPVVFVPGIADFADDYGAVFDRFGDRRLVVVEVRGRGGSDTPPSGYSAQDQASDVDAVLAAIGIDAFHLMTFSRGTTAALDVAVARADQILTLSIGDYLPAEVALPDGPPTPLGAWESAERSEAAAAPVASVGALC